jgi:hypothetical protein
MNRRNGDEVTIAILAKDKAHTLPIYLNCIENLDYPKERICLYVKTNNNNDNTLDVLSAWLKRVTPAYREVFFDHQDIDAQVQNYKQHEWNIERFIALAKIRNESMSWAHKRKCHYFVADCDNFVYPETLRAIASTNLPIVAPLLRHKTLYSNFHAEIDVNGFYLECPIYYDFLHQRIKGLIEVPVVHCTYYVRHDVIPHLNYDDNTNRAEYVMFSDSARRKNIHQFLDTRRRYGWITMAETSRELEQESWIKEFTPSKSRCKCELDALHMCNFCVKATDEGDW